MTQLADLLHRDIAANGALSVSHYMSQCLLHEAHGYYSTKHVFGAQGDFITAPEISQLFGEMLAAYHAHMHQLFGAPSDAITFEAGPGRGILASDMRRAYGAFAPALHAAPGYLLEASQKLKQVQIDALAGHHPTSDVPSDVPSGTPFIPHHISTIQELPKQPLFGIANEFFDALGVNQAIYHKGAWHYRLITSQEGDFAFTIGAPLTQTDDFGPLPDAPQEGDIIEHCPQGEAMMAELAHHIAYYGGALLIIDYGKSDNKGDSLQAVRAHQPCDILSYQGEADITHWVDFSALSRVANAHHARLIGPVTQGRFLKDIGIAERAEALRTPDNPETDRALLAAIDRLVSPAQMGHAFKVALLVPNGDGLPPGFMSGEAS